MTKWIFLGDESRRIFVSWILKTALEELDEEKSLLIQHGENSLEKNFSEEGNLIFSTYNLPPGIEIFLPAYSENLNIDTSAFDNCAIFEMFPFGKESTEDLARLLETSKKNSPAILFVMMDVVEDEENSPVGLNAMKNIFSRKHRDILTARDESDILEILHWHRPLTADVVNLIRQEIQDIYHGADEISEEYEKFLSEQKRAGCLSESAKNRIVNFSSVRGKTHIWTSYRDAALGILFSQSKFGGIKNLIALYRRTLYQDEQQSTVAALVWDADSDCAALEKKILARFGEIMRTPKKFQSLVNADEIYSEHSYLALIRKGSRFGEIDKEFLSVYENFVREEAREILTKELASHLEKLKNM